MPTVWKYIEPKPKTYPVTSMNDGRWFMYNGLFHLKLKLRDDGMAACVSFDENDKMEHANFGARANGIRVEIEIVATGSEEGRE